MDLMPQPLELPGQVVDTDTLAAAVHVTAIGQEVYLH